jgi:catechol 2,3-dioxygenase-like lactoylglutathione lyase family enzyme
MSYRFHHVHIVCKELETMVRFFTEVLEARLIDMRKFGTADGASLDLNGTTVNLRVAKEGEKMKVKRCLGMLHNRRTATIISVWRSKISKALTKT